MIDGQSLAEVRTDISASRTSTKKNGTRYNITQEQLIAAYKVCSNNKELANVLGCSIDCLRRWIKKYGLAPLSQHGGARANSGGKRDGAGRPAGSKNKGADIEYIQMMEQLGKDQRANSFEVGVGKKTLNAQDIATYAGSAFDSQGRCNIAGSLWASYYDNKTGEVKLNTNWIMGLPRQLKTV